jgi:hypothetical protein
MIKANLGGIVWSASALHGYFAVLVDGRSRTTDE